MKKTSLIFLFGMLLFQWVKASIDTIPIQKESTLQKISRFPMLGHNKYKFNYESLSIFYPMQENPTVAWKSKMRSGEAILFDFHPILSLQFYNDFEEQMKKEKLISMSYYFSFRPHFRMFAKTSSPVQMPSYKIFVGLRHLYRINEKHFLGYGIETGHYSNGQNGCALKGGGADQSASCDSMYALVNSNSNLSEMINRVNGDFSTNLSKLDIAYRYIAEYDSVQGPKQIHAFTLGIVKYHNNFMGIVDFGGFTDNSIAMYGQWRFLVSYAYSYQWNSGYRIRITEDIEFIQGAHPSVNPFRSLTAATLYFPRNIGVFASYNYGHDDYNLRFVDSGHQFGVGITWDMFAPKKINED